MQLLRSIAALALASLAGAEPEGMRTEEPFVDIGFKDALARAERRDKLVMIDFFTTWCAPCKKMDRETWTDPAVRAWLRREVVPLKVDAEVQTALAEHYAVDGYPTILFVRPDGRVRGRIVGFMAPERFLPTARDALLGIKPSDRFREALGEAGLRDPFKRMELAGHLVRDREYAEALEELFWCFEHGVEADPEFAEARDTALVRELAGLHTRWPRAAKRSAAHRAALAARVVAGEATVDEAEDLVTLNRAFGDEPRTLATYDALRATDAASAELVATLFASVWVQLVDARRYGDVLAGLGDPERALRAELARLEEAVERAPNRASRASLKRAYVERLARIYEAALGAGGRDELAGRLADALLAAAGGRATREALARGASRAGRPELARGFVERAEASAD